ncbi:MAG TPA: alcohol dehydrogenase catalytic domain-containing protein [Verrucomicrobiae bacterium]|nr:alcohol dehydrogenase catalytic domain-containing protein [Verrucomicrobiae bacterium]
MQAVVKRRPGPGFELGEVALPEPGPGEALLEVLVAGICGTDLHLVDWTPWAAGRVVPPRVMGHEMAGRVRAVGPGVERPRVGELVGVESHLVDLVCRPCRRGDFHICAATRILGVDVDGTFAPAIAVPARNCWPTPPTLSPEVTAFQEPMGNAVHAALQGPLRGATVLVTGSGPIGCAAVGIARAEGADRVVAVDRSAERLQLAQAMGADQVVDTQSAGADLVDRLADACGGEADVVLEMAGDADLLRAALTVTASGGWVSLLGLGLGEVTLDLDRLVVMRGVTVFGVTGRRQFATWERTTGYLESGAVDVGPILTHRFPLGQFAQALEIARSGRGGKVLIYPGEHPLP